MNAKLIFNANLAQPIILSKHYSGPVVIHMSPVIEILISQLKVLFLLVAFSNHYMQAKRPINLKL